MILHTCNQADRHTGVEVDVIKFFFFPTLQVGGRNQIQKLHFEEHLIKQYPFYLRALVPQHPKTLDFSVEIKFVHFIGCLRSAAGSFQKDKNKMEELHWRKCRNCL